jgi:hypothetical protein
MIGASRRGRSAWVAFVACLAGFVAASSLTGCGQECDTRALDEAVKTIEALHDDQPQSGGPIDAKFRSPDSTPFRSENLPKEQTSTPEIDRYGWGAWQPAQMARPLVGGSSERPISAERRALLASQLERGRAAALALGTVAKAEAAGYVRAYDNFQSGRGFEYVNFGLIDGEVDVDRPEILAFTGKEPASPVAAIAYYVRAEEGDPPPDTLPTEAIPWHSHWAICRKGGEYIDSQHPEECRAQGGEPDESLTGWMVDLWLVPGWENPWGLVSSKHPDLMAPAQ